jgi:hypothetical protein
MRKPLWILGLVIVGVAIGTFWAIVSLGFSWIKDYDPDLLDPKRRLAEAEAELKAASHESERWYPLCEAAMMHVEAGSIEKARSYAEELLRLTPDHPAYGNAVHKGNLTLGRIALRAGDIEAAKKHLLAAGRTPGSPPLDSFGPNMTLAKELLKEGEREVVLEYFRQCAVFWKMDRGQLRRWSEQVEDGKIPDFGANLFF